MGNPKRIPITNLNQEINMKYNYDYLFNLFAEKVGFDWIKYPFLNLIDKSIAPKLQSSDYSNGRFTKCGPAKELTTLTYNVTVPEGIRSGEKIRLVGQGKKGKRNSKGKEQ